MCKKRRYPPGIKGLGNGAAGCAEEENDDVKTRGIQTSSEAKDLAYMINNSCNTVRDSLPGEYYQSYTKTFTYQEYSNNKGGKAIVTGTKERIYSSSSSLVSNSLDIDITIQFQEWIYADSPSSYQKFTGTINFSYDSYNSTTSSSYYSSMSKSIKGSGLRAEYRYLSEYHILDTIAIDVRDKNDNDLLVTGSVTASSGSIYPF